MEFSNSHKDQEIGVCEALLTVSCTSTIGYLLPKQIDKMRAVDITTASVIPVTKW